MSTKDVGGQQRGRRRDRHTRHGQAAEQSASNVTSVDRNRRACGGGCALFVSRLSRHTLTHSEMTSVLRIIQADYISGQKHHRKATERMPVCPFLSFVLTRPTAHIVYGLTCWIVTHRCI